MLKIAGKVHHTLGFVLSRLMDAEEDNADSEMALIACRDPS